MWTYFDKPKSKDRKMSLDQMFFDNLDLKMFYFIGFKTFSDYFKDLQMHCLI